MNKEKNIKENKCWACAKEMELWRGEGVPSCCVGHYKLFMKSFSGETIDELLIRLPEARKYL